MGGNSMKKNRVKGFTLVELIIVMAIFSVIMFGALQLMTPAGKLFDRSYAAEDVSAAQSNIKKALETNLRYAQYISVRDTAPSTEDLTKFINMHYNGKLVKTGSSIVPASNKVYVMTIDNENGGIIKVAEYNYTAGDIKNSSAVGTETDASKGSATVSFVEENELVNKAMYTNYHFMISPCVTTTSPVTVTEGGENVEKATIVKDSVYYSSFTDTAMTTFNSKNFVFTINAYKTGTADMSVSPHIYDEVFPFTATMALMNANAPYAPETYLHYEWEDPDSDGVFTKKINEDVEDTSYNTLFYDSSRVYDTAFSASASITGGATELNQIYIIYTYPDKGIIN